MKRHALLLVSLLAACSPTVPSTPATSAPPTLPTATAPASVTPSTPPVDSGTGATTAPIAVLPGEPWIVYQGGLQLPIRMVRPDGSGDHELLDPPLDGEPGHPAWSPDGGQIAFDLFTEHAATPGKERVAIWVVDPDGSNPRELAACEMPCLQTSYPAWSPDGTKLAITAYDVTPENVWGPSRVQVFDVATGERSTVAESDDGLTGYYTPRWSPDGRSIVFTIETYTDLTETTITGSAIAVVPADGSDAPRVLTQPELFAGEPDWWPGDQIVFGAGRNKAADGRLMLIRPDGSDVRPLTSFGSGEGIAIEATWIDGGARIMFVRGDGRSACRIATIDPDGSALQVADWTLQSTPRCDARTHAHLRPN